MATPSAILSVLLSADDATATAKLTAYSRKLDEINLQAKKGISTRLGGNFDDAAFRKYQVATDSAARKAADRKAFKAELGANFSPTGFRAYQKAVAQASADTAAAESKTGRFGNTLGALGGAAKAAAVAVVGIGASAAIVGTESVKAAATFQQSMELIHTQAHATQQQVDALSKSVLALAPATGTGPDVLADGLYHLISQGLKPGAQAMNALRVAAEGAKVGNANLVDVTNALGAVVASGVKGTSNLDKAMASLNATVGAGDMHLQDLADAFGTGLLGPMKQFGVNLQDINAALAVFGDNNIRGADAGTKLASAIRIMAAPSNASAAALASVGLGATTLANDLRSGPGGLLKAMEDLKGALQDSGKTASEQARVLTEAFGGRQSTGVQLLLGQLGRLQLKEEAVGGGATSLGDAWKATQNNMSFQLDKLRTTFETLGIAIGNALAPVVPILVKWSGALTKFVEQMEAGRGAGGRFANDIKTAFDVVKTAVVDTVDALGGLKSTIEVLVSGYAISKIIGFAGALSKIGGGAKAASGAVGAATGVEGAAGAGVLSRAAGVLSSASALAFIAPIGIALTAVVGGWIKTDAQAEGKKFATQFLGPMPDAIKQHFEKPISDAVNRVGALNRNQRTTQTVSSLGSRASGLSTDAAARALANSATANAAIIREQYFKLGQAAGEATAQGLKSVKDISEPVVLDDFLSRLKDLPAQARPEAAKAMISFAAELQAQGKLPVKAVQDVMHNLEAQVPGLSAYLEQQGLKSDDAFAKALKFTTATRTLTTTLSNYRQQFGDWTIATKITGNNIVQNMTLAMDHLHETVKTSTGETRKDAIDDIQKLHDQATQLFSSMASKTAQSAKDMQGTITSSTSQAATIGAANLSGLAQAVYGAVRSGAVNAKQGSEYIQKALNATLKAFGATPIPDVTLAEVALSSAFSPQVGAFPKAGVGGGGKPAGAARGRLMQFGRPGEGGRDSIPLNVGGMPITVAPGEQVAVFNRHQLPVVNAALAPMGGLPGLFSKVNKPNYMASGGMASGFAGGGVVGEVNDFFSSHGFDKIAIAGILGNAWQESSGNPNTPGGGLWQQISNFGQGTGGSLLNQMQVMLPQILGLRSALNSAGSPGAAATIFEQGFEKAGIPALANRIRYANEAFAGQLGGSLTGGAAAAAIAAIAAPAVKGAGAIAGALTASFRKEAAAANAYASKLSATTTTGAVASGPIPTGSGAFFSPSQLGSLDGLEVAKWIIPEVLWARSHGWGGRVSSGWRSPSEVVHGVFATAPQGQSEHQYDIYPHGAIDVSDYQQFAQVIAAYPGVQKLLQLSIDPLHFSGTGHSRGGMLPFAGSFDKGGVVPGAKGMPSVAIVHGQERIMAASGLAPGLTGIGQSGLGGTSLPQTIINSALTGHPSWITPQEQKAIGDAQKQIAAAAVATIVKQLGSIPSQGIGGQIALQGLQNKYTLAQNAGNTGGQVSADQAILKLENKWLTADRGQLKTINKQLSKRGLSKKTRAGLLQDKLALIQEIGTVEGDIGSTQADLTSLTTAPTTDTSGVGDTGSTDTTATDDLTAAIEAQTQAMTELKASIDAQSTYMKSVGAVETSQAIKALSDVISGNIGGLAYSRQTGSAGDGTVVRY